MSLSPNIFCPTYYQWNLYIENTRTADRNYITYKLPENIIPLHHPHGRGHKFAVVCANCDGYASSGPIVYHKEKCTSKSQPSMIR